MQKVSSDYQHDLAYQSARTNLEAAMRQEFPDAKFEDYEAAVAYGFLSGREHQAGAWNDDLAHSLRSGWSGDWQKDGNYVRRGWELGTTGIPSARPPMVAKPFDSLPETPKGQPAVTNHTPDTTH